ALITIYFVSSPKQYQPGGGGVLHTRGGSKTHHSETPHITGGKKLRADVHPRGGAIVTSFPGHATRGHADVHDHTPPQNMLLSTESIVSL
ncbi:unnamed protein product, partial [Ectocarpus sp. 12 AP-2014]